MGGRQTENEEEGGKKIFLLIFKVFIIYFISKASPMLRRTRCCLCLTAADEEDVDNGLEMATFVPHSPPEPKRVRFVPSFWAGGDSSDDSDEEQEKKRYPKEKHAIALKTSNFLYNNFVYNYILLDKLLWHASPTYLEYEKRRAEGESLSIES